MSYRVGFSIFVCGTVLAAPVAALAEAGELYTGLEASIEYAEIGYIREGLVGGPAFSTPSEIVPRLGAFARYALSNELQLGVAFQFTLEQLTVYERVTVDGRTGDLRVNYSEWSLPLTISYLYSRGYASSLVGSLEIGITSPSFEEESFVDPTRLDENGNPGTIPIELRSDGSLGFLLGGRIEWDWRVSSWLVFDVGPYIALRTAPVSGGTASNLQLGFAVRPSVVWAAGPRLF